MYAHKIVATILVAPLFCAALFAGPQTPRRIEITASKFSYSPNQITLKKGEPVVLVLHSTDVTHGLKIPDLSVNTTEIKKGKDSEIPLAPTKIGHFTGKCAHFCGSGHGSMTMQIDVVD
jgi:cytochrome c oxidase subunit II